jgi:single stranded DNA-binding protein
MNTWIFSGRLTRDPESHTTNTGRNIADFSIANNDYKDKPIYVNCVAWDEAADFILQYFTKGKPIEVVGRYDQDTWEDKTTGEKRTATKLILTQKPGFVSISNNPKSDDESKSETNEVQKRARTKREKVAAVATEENEDENIPF